MVVKGAVAAPETPNASPTGLQRWRVGAVWVLGAAARSPQAGLVLVIALLMMGLGLFAGSHIDRVSGQPINSFLNSYTLIQTATDASFFAIMAVGATVVIISGGIDLSVGSIYALSGTSMALALRAAGPVSPAAAVLLALAICLVVGLGSGLINGLLVVGLKVHPFVITLGSMWVLRGLAFVTSKAESILVPEALTAVAKAPLGLGASLYPVPMLVMLAVTAAGAVYLSRTVAGRHVLAVGGKPRSQPLRGPAHRSRAGGCVCAVGPVRGDGRLPGRQLLRVGILWRRHRVRTLCDRQRGGGRGQPFRGQGQRRVGHAGGAC